MSENEIDPNKTLLDKALELSLSGSPESEEKTNTHLMAMCELALAYIDGKVTPESVAKVLNIKRNLVSTWWPSTLMQGLRHGYIEVGIKGRGKPLSSYSRKW